MSGARHTASRNALHGVRRAAQEGLERLAVGPPAIVDGEIAVPDAPGLGIRLDRDRLPAAHEVYRAKALGARDDAAAMRRLVPGWEFDPKRPSLVR